MNPSDKPTKPSANCWACQAERLENKKSPDSQHSCERGTIYKTAKDGKPVEAVSGVEAAPTASATRARELYDAYLLGCEDECIPEPKTFERFIAMFHGAYCKACGASAGESHNYDCPEAQD